MYSEYERMDEDIAQVAAAKYFDLDDPSQIKVLSMNLNEGSSLGDGFTSAIQEVDISYEMGKSAGKDAGEKRAGNLNLLGKFASKGSRVSNWWVQMKMFERETEFYGSIVPEIEKRYAAANPSGEPLPLPKCFYANPAHKLIIMEDLKREGYKLCQEKDKTLVNALNLDQLRFTLRELARFHAASYDFVNNYPGGNEAFDRDFPWVGNGAKLGQFMTRDEQVSQETKGLYNGMQRKIAALLRQSDMDPSILDRLDRFQASIDEDCGGSKHPRDHKFTMVVHGDLWSNNVLFRTDEASGKVTGVKFVDLQEAMRSRPTTDVCFLFSTSMLPELRKDHWRSLLEYYHKQLVSSLQAYGYRDNLYTMDQLLQDYRSNFGHGFYWSLVNAYTFLSDTDVNLALILSDDDQVAGLAKKSTNQNAAEAAAPPTHRKFDPDCPGWKRIQALVKEAAEHGVF